MYADNKGFCLLGNNIHITVKTTGGLLFAEKKVILEVYNNTFTHIFPSHLRIAQRHSLRSDSFKREPKFVQLGTTTTDKHFMLEEEKAV
jgi:hypothetical protein